MSFRETSTGRLEVSGGGVSTCTELPRGHGLQHRGAAPTRDCLLDHTRAASGFGDEPILAEHTCDGMVELDW